METDPYGMETREERKERKIAGKRKKKEEEKKRKEREAKEEEERKKRELPHEKWCRTCKEKTLSPVHCQKCKPKKDLSGCEGECDNGEKCTMFISPSYRTFDDKGNKVVRGTLPTRDKDGKHIHKVVCLCSKSSVHTTVPRDELPNDAVLVNGEVDD